MKLSCNIGSRGVTIIRRDGTAHRLSQPVLVVLDHRRPKRDGFALGVQVKLGRRGNTISRHGVTARWKVHVLSVVTSKGKVTFHLRRYIGATVRHRK